METFNIYYEGINYEVTGEYEESDDEVGYKGGWVTIDVCIDGNTIFNHLKEWVIEKLGELVLEKI